jgi:hypothetical protein
VLHEGRSRPLRQARLAEFGNRLARTKAPVSACGTTK